jgi:hypothetical protein
MLGRIGLRVALLASLGAALLAPAAASADSVKVGSTLANPVSGYYSSYLSIQLKSATVPSGVSPTDGVITSWALRTGALAQTYSLAVLHPKADASGYTITGFNRAPQPTTGTPDTIYTYAAPSVPVLKGDFIGLAAEDAPGPDIPRHVTGNPGDVVGGYSNFPHQLGDSLGATSMNLNAEMLFQATVKFCKVPDVRGKKGAEAKRLIAAADCTPKVTKKKAKKKKRRRVVRQKTAAGTTGVPGTTVEIVVGKKKK